MFALVFPEQETVPDGGSDYHHERTVHGVVEFLGESFAQLGTVESIGLILRVVIRIVAILLLARIALALSRRIIDRLFAPRTGRKGWRHLDEKRAKTVSSLVTSVANYTIFFVTAVMILDSMGINTASLLAAAGIVGLAVGFGAQHLVKDVVAGFFILLENQFQVGDYVTVAGVTGYVERTGLRTTWIRSTGGETHIIPNGEMRKVTNHMGQQMRVTVNVSIAHGEDVERALDVLTAAFEKAKAEGELADITEGPKVLGVSDLNDSGVELLLWARAKTMKQFGMSRELRMLAKQTLDAHGIKPGYAHRHVVFDSERSEGPHSNGHSGIAKGES